MSNQKVFANVMMAWVVVLSWAILLGAAPVVAQGSAANYAFLVGAGFLCDRGDSSACQAVVRSANGDSYELSGSGTFATQSKSATAAGTYTHKSSNGNVLETGVWTASELVSFDSYGIAPGALMPAGQAFGPTRFGPMRSRMFSGSMPAGGLAVFRIRLLPMWGASRAATLQVNCALGKVPDEHQTEGIRLSFEGAGGEFDQEISGRTMFVLTGPGISPTPKPPAPSGEGNGAPAETQR